MQSDISAMLLRKTQMQANKHSAGWMTLEKSRLTQARTLAIRRQDDAEVALINEQLKELADSVSASGNIVRDEGDTDMLAKVNERNRKANIEAVRKAEIAETERKRRERKIAAAGGVVNQDPSARLKTLPRTFNAATPSRFVLIFSVCSFYMPYLSASATCDLICIAMAFYSSSLLSLLYCVVHWPIHFCILCGMQAGNPEPWIYTAPLNSSTSFSAIGNTNFFKNQGVRNFCSRFHRGRFGGFLSVGSPELLHGKNQFLSLSFDGRLYGSSFPVLALPSQCTTIYS